MHVHIMHKFKRKEAFAARKFGLCMAKVSTNISIDADTKVKAQELLAEFGLDLSTAVNIFLSQMVRENAIPFVIGRDVSNTETLGVPQKRRADRPVTGVRER